MLVCLGKNVLRYLYFSDYCVQNEHLEAVLREKDDELNRIRRQHSDDMARRLEELRQLRENYDTKIQEYELLMDVKVQLDQEIATYRALLMEEETRLAMQLGSLALCLCVYVCVHMSYQNIYCNCFPFS